MEMTTSSSRAGAKCCPPCFLHLLSPPPVRYRPALNVLSTFIAAVHLDTAFISVFPHRLGAVADDMRGAAAGAPHAGWYAYFFDHWFASL